MENIIERDDNRNDTKRDQNYSKSGRKDQGRKGGKRGNQRAGSVRRGPHNDFAWYNKYPEQTKTVATVYYSNPTGYLVPNLQPGGSKFAAPGICVMRSIPCPGIATDATSPINVAISKLFVFTRKGNMGSVPYEQADFGIYLYGLCSMHTSIAYLSRIYGLITRYEATNLYWPRHLFEAMGLDYDSFKGNRPKLRDFIITLQQAINARAFPKDYAILKRYIWMYSNLFIDSGNTKGQLYVHVPEGHYEYEPFKDKRGGNLFFNRYAPGHKYTLDELIEMFSVQFDKFLNDQDMAIISGDLYKVYGEAGCMQWNPIESEMTIEPIYNTTVLEQIQNATFPTPWWVQCAHEGGSGTNSFSHLNIKQKDGYMYYRPGATMTQIREAAPSDSIANYPAEQWINNQHMLDPDVEHVMVSTRMTALYEYSEEAEYKVVGAFAVSCCGSEIPVSCTIYQFKWNTESGNVGYVQAGRDWISRPWYTDDGGVLSDNYTSMGVICAASNFDWMPIAIPHYYDVSDLETSVDSLGIIGDIDNWLIMPFDLLSKLHRTALWSLYANEASGQMK